MITIIKYIIDKINNIRIKNRNKKSNFKLFLIWLTVLIIITLIFYYFDLFKLDDQIGNNLIELNPLFDNKIIPNPVSTQNLGDNIKINKDNNLYNQILKDVGNIPKPLKFVDNYNFEF